MLSLRSILRGADMHSAGEVTMRARSFGTEALRMTPSGLRQKRNHRSPTAALLAGYFQLAHHGMKSRRAYAYPYCRSVRPLDHSITFTKRTKNIFCSHAFQGRQLWLSLRL